MGKVKDFLSWLFDFHEGWDQNAHWWEVIIKSIVLGFIMVALLFWFSGIFLDFLSIFGWGGA